MTTAEIRHQLEIQHQDLQQFLQSHSPEQVQAQRDGKWSVLQNIEHLYKALVQVNKAIKKPSFLLRRAFGKPNRPLRSYEQLVQRYPLCLLLRVKHKRLMASACGKITISK
jgi:hypothetical protein